MKMSNHRLLAASLIAVALTLGACAERRASLSDGATGTFKYPSPTSYWRGDQVDPIGTLTMPEGVEGKVPVMLILHGSGGQGYRDWTWSAFLNELGVATFRINYYQPRGLVPPIGPGGPTPIQDVQGALPFLATHPQIDAERMGIMGFSRGGSVTLGTMRLRPYPTGDITPKLYVGLYPGCMRVNVDRQTTDEKVLIIVGTSDTLSYPEACVDLGQQAEKLGKNFEIVVIDGATHGFDGNKRGAVRFGGATYHLKPDQAHTEIAREAVKRAAYEAFGLAHASD
ncbi:MAG: dienelactone hydrolase family protein [Marivibrio sp.]|uniref:dienelactone hydrolase family protein n=1 Tax=Marivibrio sp. TaxID=2039719 RepID=UPI0032EEED09